MIPGLGRSPGEGNGNLFQYSCLGNPTDRGGSWATICGVAKSRTRPKGLNTRTYKYISKKKTETEIKGKCYFPSHP